MTAETAGVVPVRVRTINSVSRTYCLLANPAMYREQKPLNLTQLTLLAYCHTLVLTLVQRKRWQLLSVMFTFSRSRGWPHVNFSEIKWCVHVLLCLYRNIVWLVCFVTPTCTPHPPPRYIVLHLELFKDLHWKREPSLLLLLSVKAAILYNSWRRHSVQGGRYRKWTRHDLYSSSV